MSHEQGVLLNAVVQPVNSVSETSDGLFLTVEGVFEEGDEALGEPSSLVQGQAQNGERRGEKPGEQGDKFVQ